MQDDTILDKTEASTRFAQLARLEEVLAKRPRATRWILCGPVALIVTLLVMMGMAHWWPSGVAKIDNIAMPVVLFPLLWAGIFFYALAEDKLARAVVTMSLLAVGNIALLIVSI